MIHLGNMRAEVLTNLRFHSAYLRRETGSARW
jgi:hypothetical protein